MATSPLWSVAGLVHTYQQGSSLHFLVFGGSVMVDDIIAHDFRSEGHLHHQVCALAVAIHHKQSWLKLLHPGSEEETGCRHSC
jgi:hypothetical protein